VLAQELITIFEKEKEKFEKSKRIKASSAMKTKKRSQCRDASLPLAVGAIRHKTHR
jgi:hypothetical protein